MYRNPGPDFCIDDSHPVSSITLETRPGGRQVPGVTPPFMFSRLFLVIGILLTAIGAAGLISG